MPGFAAFKKGEFAAANLSYQRALAQEEDAQVRGLLDRCIEMTTPQRIAVADFSVTGDVGIADAGKAVAELLLPKLAAGAGPAAATATSGCVSWFLLRALRNTLPVVPFALFPRGPGGDSPLVAVKKMKNELPVIERTYDLMKWFLGRVAKFPRSHRYSLGQRIESRLYDVMEQLIRAKYAERGSKAPHLAAVNLDLEVLRFFCRLAHELALLPHKSHEYAVRELNEVGRLVGGWLRQQRQATSGSD